MYRKLRPATLAIASVACVITLNVASAATSPGPAGIAASAAQRQVRLAETVAAQPKTTRKTKRAKVEHPKTNWLNPQPEPPSPAGNKPIQGGNWLNPQPEPPRPDTAKKLH